MPAGGCLGWPAPITIRSGSASGNGLAAEVEGSNSQGPSKEPKGVRSLRWINGFRCSTTFS